MRSFGTFCTRTVIFAFLGLGVQVALLAGQPAQIEVEVRTDVVAKYLPNHQVIATIRSKGARGLVVREKKTRRSVPLDEHRTSAQDEKGEHYVTSQSASDFIKSVGIRIDDAKTAIEVAQLFEDITLSPNAIQCTMFNENNYHLYDNRPYTAKFRRPEHWKWVAEFQESMWVVRVRYVGPPAMTAAPDTFRLFITNEGRFSQIRMTMK